MPNYQEFIIPNHPNLRLRVYAFGCKTYTQRIDNGYCAMLDGEAVPRCDLNPEQRTAFDHYLFNVFPE